MGPSVISWWPSGTSDLVSVLMVFVCVDLENVDESDKIPVLLLCS